jgi:hypothetical protein
MGFFNRIRQPVSGTATVTAATEPTGMRSPQEARMTLSVSGIGFEPFTVEHEEKCHTDRWPKVGMSVPVVFDLEHHDRIEVKWADVQPGQESTPPAATPQPTMPVNDAIPPEAQQVVDQLQNMFGGAAVTSHMETKVIDLSNNPEARAQMMGPLEAMTGMDLDGDGSVGGNGAPASTTPPAAGNGAIFAAASSSGDDAVSRLERLAALHKQGVLTDEEFAQQKKRLLDTL